MSDARVFVTGLGAISAIGNSLSATWDALKSKRHGFAELQQADLSGWSHALAGEIKDYKPANLLPDRKLLKVISKQDVLGINAAMQAIKHSQLLSYRDELADPEGFNEETAVYVGSPGNKFYQEYDFLPLMAKTNSDMQPFAEQLFSEVHPMWLLRILPNNVLAYTGITYGFKGANHNIINHAVGGMQAMIEAYHAIKTGQAQRAVVIAYDVGAEPQGLYYYNKLGVLSARHLKPFDIEHDGTLMAEGAAAIVLESAESAQARSAVCYAELLGGTSASEASGLFSLEPEGHPLSTLIDNTLVQTTLSPDDFGMVVAHGNGNPASDLSEARAITQVFGEQNVPVTAFKWSVGHTVCASGMMDVVLATQALGERCVPGIAPLQTLAPGCAGLSVSADHRSMDPNKHHIMVLNRGFASMNASVVLKACD